MSAPEKEPLPAALRHRGGLKDRAFAALLSRFSAHYNEQTAESKKLLLSPLRHSGAAGPLQVLEIGVGTGASFSFYAAEHVRACLRVCVRELRAPFRQ